MMGAIFACATELAWPGVPLKVALERQVCPELFDTRGFTTSRDRPKPSCSATQIQPRWLLLNSGPRWRMAQSPSVAYTTLSMFSPSGFSISTSSPLLPSTPVQPPTTLVMPGYLAWKTATSAAITRYAPDARLISFVIVKSTPLLIRQPCNGTAFVPI